MSDSQTEPVIARFTWDEATFRRAVAANRTRTFYRLPGLILSLFALVAGAIVIHGIAGRGVKGGDVLMLLLVAVWFAWPVLYTLYAAACFKKDPFRDSDIEWRFTSEGASTRTGEGTESSFGWHIILAIEPVSKGVFVRLHGCSTPTWVPRGAFRSDDAVEALVALGREHIGKVAPPGRLRCADCGYDLSAHAEAEQCPECAFSLAATRLLRKDAPARWQDTAISVIAALVFLAFGCVGWYVIFGLAWKESPAVAVTGILLAGLGASFACALIAGRSLRRFVTMAAYAYATPIAFWGIVSLMMLADEGWPILIWFAVGVGVLIAAWLGARIGQSMRRRAQVVALRP